MNKNRSPLPEDDLIRKEISALLSRRIERLCERLVGYDRFVGEHAYQQLTELYRALRLYVNCFQPRVLLLSKQRNGKKVRYVYDPAKTPLQRLLLSGGLSAQKQQELLEVAHALDPIRLFQQIELLQKAVFRCAISCPPFVSSIPPALIRFFSVERCMTGKLLVEESVPAIRQRRSTPCTESRSAENGSWAGLAGRCSLVHHQRSILESVHQ